MQTHFIIAVIFAVTVFMAYMEDYLKESQKVAALAGYVVLFIILATTKSVEHTADAENYEAIFLNNDDFINELTTEPTYRYLSKLVLALGGNITVMFFLYAVIAIPLKVITLNKMTPYIFTAMLIYIPIYFELHDMVQIRAAAAAAFLLASLIPLSEKRWVVATLLMICAVFFHYSALIFFPFLVLGNYRLNRFWRIVVACILPVCFAMYFMKKDLLSLLPSSLTEGKIDLYKETTNKGMWVELALPYKNLYFMTKCVLLYLYLYFYDTIVENNKLAPIFINIFAASLFILLTMATIPVLGGRASELYGIVDCIVFTFSMYIVLPKNVARSAIAFVGLYMLVFNMFFTEYFTK